MHLPQYQVADEFTDDYYVLGWGNQRQPSQPLSESRHQILRQVRRAEKQVRQEEQPGLVLGVEDLRLEHGIQLDEDVGIVEVVRLDEIEEALERQEAHRPSDVQGVHEEVGEEEGFLEMRQDLLQQDYE